MDRKMSSAQRRAHWREVVGQWAESGLSKAAFCRQRNLNLWQLHYWHRRLKELDDQAAAGAAFVEVPPVSSSGLRLVLPNGLALELARDFDAETLGRFLAAVGRC